MFLKGGMIRNLNNTTHCVTMPGDVGHGSIIKKVSSQLDGVVKGTIILTIKKRTLIMSIVNVGKK